MSGEAMGSAVLAKKAAGTGTKTMCELSEHGAPPRKDERNHRRAGSGLGSDGLLGIERPKVPCRFRPTKPS
jgi:hypothetical protein